MSPEVTVLIPCYNAAQYLEASLISIVNQTYQNLTILVLDDGSTDNSVEIIKRLADTDPRIKLHRNESNLGIIKSRNRLLDLCDSELGAWMDADDISATDRIEKQVMFMSKHSEYVACSSNFIRLTNGVKKPITFKPVQLSKEYLLFYNYVLNPGSMFRPAVCRKHNIRFRTYLSGASDFQFWVELAKFGKIGLIQEYLMTYRVHGGQETVAQKYRQSKGCLEIVSTQLSSFGCECDIWELARLLIYPAVTLNKEFQHCHLKSAEEIINTVYASDHLDNFDKEVVKELLFHMYRKLAWRTGIYGFYRFVKLFGFSGLQQCRYFGFELLKYAIESDAKRLIKN